MDRKIHSMRRDFLRLASSGGLITATAGCVAQAFGGSDDFTRRTITVDRVQSDLAELTGVSLQITIQDPISDAESPAKIAYKFRNTTDDTRRIAYWENVPHDYSIEGGSPKTSERSELPGLILASPELYSNRSKTCWYPTNEDGPEAKPPLGEVAFQLEPLGTHTWEFELWQQEIMPPSEYDCMPPGTYPFGRRFRRKQSESDKTGPGSTVIVWLELSEKADVCGSQHQAIAETPKSSYV